MSTELYKVKRYSRVRVCYDPGDEHSAVIQRVDDEFEFDHIDGMYSYCKDDDGNVYHLAAWTPVNVIREGPPDDVEL